MGINLKKMKYIFYLTIVLFFSCDGKMRKGDISAKSTPIKITDSGYIDTNYLELIDSSGIALLKVNGKLFKKVNMNPPCYFIKIEKDIQFFKYPEIDVKNAVIIAGYTEDKTKSNHSLCGNTIQGFLIKKDTMLLKDKIYRAFETCPNYSLDEKNFWHVAHY